MASTPANMSIRPLDEILEEVVFDQNAMEIVFTDKARVSCMGTGGALGHPLVYYTMDARGYTECGYCDRVFVYDPSRAGQVIEGGFGDSGGHATADATRLSGGEGSRRVRSRESSGDNGAS